MHENRRKARDWLNRLSLTDFKRIMQEARIADDDIEILDMKFIHGYSNVKIACKANISLDQVNYTVKRVYDRIAGLLDF